MEIASLGMLSPMNAAQSNTLGRKEKAVNDFNALLLEMFLRESGVVSLFGDAAVPGGEIMGDMMTQVLASQLAGQFHLVTAADLFGVDQ